MAKAKRDMQKMLRIADIVVEVLDARAPQATQNPDIDRLFGGKPRVVVLNKEDLADPAATARWAEYFRQGGCIPVPLCAVKSGKHRALFQAVDLAAGKAVETLTKKGVQKTVRAMVVGIPNVGKSSLINILHGEKKAKTGASPGVTLGQQWVRISPMLELLDTPGVLWPKFEENRTAEHLAFIGSIRDDVLETVDLAKRLIDVLKAVSPDSLKKRYKLDSEDEDAVNTLCAIAKARGCVVRGGELDIIRAADILIKEFRQGKLGRITLELPQEGALNETRGDGKA